MEHFDILQAGVVAAVTLVVAVIVSWLINHKGPQAVQHIEAQAAHRLAMLAIAERDKALAVWKAAVAAAKADADAATKQAAADELVLAAFEAAEVVKT